MVYIGVEFRDKFRGRTANFGQQYHMSKLMQKRKSPSTQCYATSLMNGVEDGVDPEWTDEQKEGYYENCDWLWWYLDDEEIEEYKERSNKL